MQDGRQDLGDGLAAKAPSSREQLIQHGAEAEDVGPHVSGLPLRLLRRHVCRGPEHGAFDGLRRVDLFVQDLGEAEVEELRGAAPGHQDVGRLEIAMQNAAPMRLFERARDRQRRSNDIVDGERAAKRLTLDVLEDEIIRTEIVELADVGMVQRRDGARLLFEPLEVIGQPLDRDRAPQPRVAGLPHLAHAARADGRFQQVRAELKTRGPLGHAGDSIVMAATSCTRRQAFAARRLVDAPRRLASAAAVGSRRGTCPAASRRCRNPHALPPRVRCLAKSRPEVYRPLARPKQDGLTRP